MKSRFSYILIFHLKFLNSSREFLTASLLYVAFMAMGNNMLEFDPFLYCSTNLSSAVQLTLNFVPPRYTV